MPGTCASRSGRASANAAHSVACAAVLLDHPPRHDEPGERHVDAKPRNAARCGGGEQHAGTASEIEEAGGLCHAAQPPVQLRREPVGRDEHLPRTRVDQLLGASRLGREHRAHHVLERLRGEVAVESRGGIAVLVDVEPGGTVDAQVGDAAGNPVFGGAALAAQTRVRRGRDQRTATCGAAPDRLVPHRLSQPRGGRRASKPSNHIRPTLQGHLERLVRCVAQGWALDEAGVGVVRTTSYRRASFRGSLCPSSPSTSPDSRAANLANRVLRYRREGAGVSASSLMRGRYQGRC